MNIVGAAPCGRPLMESKPAGILVEKWLLKIESKFENVKIDKLIVMPNHIHLIILMEGDHVGSPLPKIINWFKTMTTNEYIQGVKDNIFPRFYKHVWQRNYFDHIIRNEEDYLRIWKNIDDNPAKWAEDEYFAKS
jgi:REP element-mobilizing transposase RayT